MRRLESQGAAQCRQPHARGSRRIDPAQAGARLDRHRAQLRPRSRAELYLVELSIARLDEERPRPPARPYVGVAGTGESSQRASGPRALPQLAAPVRPRSADLRAGCLTERSELRSAIAALKS